MHRLYAVLAVSFCVAGGASAAPKLPANTAFDRPLAGGARAGCLDSTRLLSHAAYVPAETMPPRRGWARILAQPRSCGHLLSTDTLLSMHKWDRT